MSEAKEEVPDDGFAEFFTKTNVLRFVRRADLTVPILQQLIQGSLGTQRWEDVPEVKE
jgi:hypothetical protein